MKFSGYYRDGAIVQRNAPVTVRGYAAASAAVKCVLSGGNIRAEKRTETDGKGRFEVVFDAVSDVETAFVLSAEAGGEKISARIRFGDVYLTLGQSNVSYSLSSTEDCGEWVRRAAEAEISVLDLPEPPYFSTEEVTRPALPLEDFCREYSWTSGKEEKIAGISALTVQTAALVSERKKMPVGAVHASMGGLSIEAYLKHETAEADKELVGFLKKVGRYNPVETYNTAGLRNFTQLSGVWNEKIAPLKGISFAGIVWYLGESSAFDFEFARFYLRELKMLLGQLRTWFGNRARILSLRRPIRVSVYLRGADKASGNGRKRLYGACLRHRSALAENGRGIVLSPHSPRQQGARRKTDRGYIRRRQKAVSENFEGRIS